MKDGVERSWAASGLHNSPGNPGRIDRGFAETGAWSEGPSASPLQPRAPTSRSNLAHRGRPRKTSDATGNDFCDYAAFLRGRAPGRRDQPTPLQIEMRLAELRGSPDQPTTEPLAILRRVLGTMQWLSTICAAAELEGMLPPGATAPSRALAADSRPLLADPPGRPPTRSCQS